MRCNKAGIVFRRVPKEAMPRGVNTKRSSWRGFSASHWIGAWLMLTLGSISADACTGFYVAGACRVLAGNNEDGSNPETKVWFVPGQGGTYGRMYVGYDDLSAQGGVNEKGLWFDAFGLPQKEVVLAHGEIYAGDLQDKLMADCATVAEVRRLLERYSRAP
jgi:hypothetical protein